MVIILIIGDSMTALNVATDIPSQITTVEQLAAWCDLVLAATYPSLVVVEGVGYNERAAQAGFFYVQAESKHIFLGRVSLTVSPGYLAGGLKNWMYVQPLGNTAIDNSFKANA